MHDVQDMFMNDKWYEWWLRHGIFKKGDTNVEICLGNALFVNFW